MIRAALLAGSILALAPGAAAAQEPVRLSVDGAVERALAADERARIARAQVDRTEGVVREAFARALPSIDGTYSMTRNLQRPVIFFNQDGEVQQISIGDAQEHAFGVSLEQRVFDRGLGAALSAARHGQRAGEAAYDRALTDVALDARGAYYRVLRARALVAVREGAMRLVEERLRQVRLFEDVGTASEFDVLTAEVAVENERPDLIRARYELDLATNALKRLAAIPFEADVELVDTLAYRPESVTLADATARALANRHDLAAQRERAALAADLVRVERAEAFPTLDLRFDVMRRASSPDFIPEESMFSQSAQASLELQIPIFDARRTQGRVLQARADAVVENEALSAIERDIRLEVLDAWQAVQAAAEGVEATSATVARARRAHEIATIRFRNGLSTQLELNEAEQNVVQAESNAAEALYLHMLARARLAHAMGER